jgi:hypothetical protein
MDALKKLSPYAHWAIRIAAAGVFIMARRNSLTWPVAPR